jgi:predicted permease
LGASRVRLIRQLLTESLLVALGGGLMGIALAYGLARWFSSMKFPSPVPIDFNITPDLTVLIFAFVLSAIAGLGFGLAPALASTRAEVAPALKEGAVSPLAGYRRFGLRNLMVAYQVAASLTLLLITGFLVLGYNRTARMDVGLNLNGLYFLSLDPVRDGYSAAKTADFFDKLPERLSRLSAVHSVAVSESAPFAGFIDVANTRFSAPKSDSDVKQVVVSVLRSRIGAGYFATLDVPVMRGREFTEQDQHVSPTSGAIQSAILNETAAREFFGKDDPIGRRITANQSMVIDTTGMSNDKPLSTSSERSDYTVIGVVRDVKTGFMSAKAVPSVYVPLGVEDYRRAPVSGTTVVFRGDVGPDAIASVRGEVSAIDSNLTIFNVRSMREQLDEIFSLITFSEAIYGGIGVFGLILASIGLAGVTGYAVARRRKEIGIRMALGARSSQVLRLVLKEGTVLVLVGSVFGFVGAFAISRALSAVTSQLAQAFSSSTGDPLLLIGAPLLLVSLAMLACYIPARRSTKIDPLRALRDE